jgi:hypothetical protein
MEHGAARDCIHTFLPSSGLFRGSNCAHYENLVRASKHSMGATNTSQIVNFSIKIVIWILVYAILFDGFISGF